MVITICYTFISKIQEDNWLIVVYKQEKPVCASGGEKGMVKEVLQSKQEEKVNVVMI